TASRRSSRRHCAEAARSAHATSSWSSSDGGGTVRSWPTIGGARSTIPEMDRPGSNRAGRAHSGESGTARHDEHLAIARAIGWPHVPAALHHFDDLGGAVVANGHLPLEPRDPALLDLVDDEHRLLEAIVGDLLGG